MKRTVLVNGKPIDLPLDAGGESFSIVETEAGHFSVLIEGRSYRVHPDRGQICVDGQCFDTEVVDPRAPKRRRSNAELQGRHTLASAMPGKVVRILAAVGDEVAAGQGILVIEAMKMQNEIKTPSAGRVVSVSVSEGATVGAGTVLAVVE